MPAGTLRATYISANPVQAFVDLKTGDVRGPAADLTRELAKRLGVPFRIAGAQGVAGVLNSLKNGEADIGFVAYDVVRARDVDFSQTYSLAQNTYAVPENSPLRSVADIDRVGVRIGVAEGDAGDLFLTRNLKHAEIKRNPGGNIDVGLRQMSAGEIAAYAANRQRLAEVVAKTPGFRLLADNFFGVEQAIAVKKGNAALLAAVEQFLDGARASGLVKSAIERAGLVGVDVAPKAAR